MNALRKFLIDRLPARYKVGLLYDLLRSTSADNRAMGDLFISPFRDWLPWYSGLGEGVNVLYGLCRAMNPETVVEIGSARGYSTCALALACRQNGRGKVYAIDPHEPNKWVDSGEDNAHDNYQFLLSRLKDYELAPTWCEVIRARSSDAAATWDKPIDLLWIDGDHTYEGVKGDFEAFRQWLGPYSLVVFHDSLWEGGVPLYLDELRHEGYHTTTVNVGPGLTLLCPVVGGTPFMEVLTRRL